MGPRGEVRLPSGLRVALVHDWITQWGGPESVLESFLNVFGEVPVHVGVWRPGRAGRAASRGLDLRTTWLQGIPGGSKRHRWLLPLMPGAFERLDLGEKDLVISSSHAFAKAVTVPPDAVHICYCHTPPRYLWDLSRFYNRGIWGALRRPMIRHLRERDRKAAARVDHFIAISRHVAGRIRRNYGREARVIYPPVDVERFADVEPGQGSYYLTGGRLTRYKSFSAAIQAANLGRFPLKVMGTGSDRARLEALAGPTVEFLGRVDDEDLPALLGGARAFLVPGPEDFGTLPVEAQAAGVPVVAWNWGGVRETVVDGQTGVLYEDQSPKGILEGLERLEQGRWRPELARRNAERFNRKRFEEEILEEVFRVLKGRRLDGWRPLSGSVVGTGFDPVTAEAIPVGHGPRTNGGPPKRRTLITGGAGFVGSHLAEALLARGEEVDVVDNLSTGDRANIAHLLPDPHFHFYRGNVMDRALMEDLVRRADHVYHLAAAVGVKLIMERPVETVVTNVRGTEIMLDLASHYGKKILVASTSEVYGKAMENGRGLGRTLKEGGDWTLGPTHKRRWAYACSKAMDEFLALAYKDDASLPVVVVRFFNIVGPRQKGRYGMVIPSFVKSALLGKPIVVHGDGGQSRSFTHVTDAVKALLKLMETPEAVGEVVNIGSGAEITINDLAWTVKEMTGSDSEIIHVPHERIYGPGFEDMRRRTPDISKLMALIGYGPEQNLNEILEDVIRYYRRQLDLEEAPAVKAAR